MGEGPMVHVISGLDPEDPFGLDTLIFWSGSKKRKGSIIVELNEGLGRVDSSRSCLLSFDEGGGGSAGAIPPSPSIWSHAAVQVNSPVGQERVAHKGGSEVNSDGCTPRDSPTGGVGMRSGIPSPGSLVSTVEGMEEQVRGMRLPLWIYHHYCAMAMALISLTWEIKGQPDCAQKQRGVQLFLQWAIMQGVAMLLQNRYQRQRLYTRIALGKARRMDVVWGETAGVEGQLWLLCPILFILQGFEAYVGLLLLRTALVGVVSEWQVVVCGILLVLMAVGNFANTVQTLVTKSRAESKDSEWVLSKVEEFGKFLGLSYLGHEKEVHDLFSLLKNMQKSGNLPQNISSLRLTPQQSLRRLGSRCSQIATGQQSSPTVFPEKRSKVKSSQRNEDDAEKVKVQEHRIDMGDEQSDLLGYEVFSGKLVLDKRTSSTSADVQTSIEITNQDAVDAKLTSKALVWGSHMLSLEDVISVSYNVGLRHFTVHSYPLRKELCGLSLFMKPRRSLKDFRFLACSSEEALQWVSGFTDQQCFVNCLPHPLVSSKKQASNIVASEFPPDPHIKCKSPPRMLVILNPRSGRGRSSKVFHDKVEPIFKEAQEDLWEATIDQAAYGQDVGMIRGKMDLTPTSVTKGRSSESIKEEQHGIFTMADKDQDRVANQDQRLVLAEALQGAEQEVVPRALSVQPTCFAEARAGSGAQNRETKGVQGTLTQSFPPSASLRQGNDTSLIHLLVQGTYQLSHSTTPTINLEGEDGVGSRGSEGHDFICLSPTIEKLIPQPDEDMVNRAVLGSPIPQGAPPKNRISLMLVSRDQTCLTLPEANMAVVELVGRGVPNRESVPKWVLDHIADFGAFLGLSYEGREREVLELFRSMELLPRESGRSQQELAGFKIEVVKTTSAGHARKFVSSVDFSTCPDGIICVGGDGIINEVLNGLLSRNDQNEAISIPIGIIPAGSDNSLVWTVLGVRDPVSAAIAIVKNEMYLTFF
ncbi:hypothetical protein HHK36_029310 [Tetracentron sinense]|uniref:DAGKc domain-containing protein n=1 Tax=Tetracentron sinense TaxID=13715 RepID=A0A834YHE9_TETSI|nr:hypothetical protein HHK36_029310 [Tetracentron sinense]